MKDPLEELLESCDFTAVPAESVEFKTIGVGAVSRIVEATIEKTPDGYVIKGVAEIPVEEIEHLDDTIDLYARSSDDTVFIGWDDIKP